MKRENSKMNARMGRAFDDERAEDFAQAGEPESYQSQVKVRSDIQKPAHGETAATVRQALPAWIRAQMEQLEMRRAARHPLEKPGRSEMRESD